MKPETGAPAVLTRRTFAKTAATAAAGWVLTACGPKRLYEVPQERLQRSLREMEATPNSGQCNHGRPTYVELKLTDIERLFGRR